MIKEQCIIAEIKKLNLTKLQKNRMFRLVDVVDINKKRKVMDIISLVKLIRKTNCNIIRFVIGPKWNRILFIDLDLEFNTAKVLNHD